MYYFPCMQSRYLNMMRQEQSYIRVLHASPNAPGVDVYANGNLIARNLTYRVFTPYLKVSSNRYTIRVYRTGTNINPIIDTAIELRPGNIYTAAAIGMLPNIQLFPVNDVRFPLESNMTNVRLIHLSPDTPAVDAVHPGQNVLFADVAYKGVTGYRPVPSGRHVLQLRIAGSNNVILTVPNIILRPRQNISFYLVGLSEGMPDLQVLIPLDGSTYLA